MSYILSKAVGRSAGIGHQFHNWIASHQLANKYRLKFVHSPFLGSHQEPQIDQPVEKWNSFLNLGLGELTEKDLPKNIKKIELPFVPWQESSWQNTTIDREEFKKNIENNNVDNILFQCGFNQFVVTDPNYIDYVSIRRKYFHNKPKPNYIDGKINVAIHIRRGDVTENGKYQIRWLVNSYYINIMKNLLEYFGDNVYFWVCTDGNYDDIRDIMDLRIFGKNIKALLWGHNVFDVFHTMVCANILVIGKSQFSVCAGQFNCNKKIVYKWSPHCVFPNSEYVESDINGDFNMELLCHTL